MRRLLKNTLIIILCVWFFTTSAIALYQPISIIKTLIQNSMATDFSSSVFDTATPAGSDSPSFADDRMREIKDAVQTRMDVDHYWEKTGTQVSGADTGEHRKILFHAPIASTPTVAADHGDLRIKDVSAKAELHWTDEDQNEVQLTSGGFLNGAVLLDNSVDGDAIELSNNVFLLAKNVAGTSVVSLIKVDASDNVVIRSVGANPAKLSSEVTLVGATDIVHKAYVDNNIGSANWTPTSYAGEQSITFPNGLILKQGTVTRTGLNTTVTFTVGGGNPVFSTITNAWVCGGTNNDSFDIAVHTLTTTTMIVRANDPGTTTIRWYAIGF